MPTFILFFDETKNLEKVATFIRPFFPAPRMVDIYESERKIKIETKNDLWKDAFYDIFYDVKKRIDATKIVFCQEGCYLYYNKRNTDFLNLYKSDELISNPLFDKNVFRHIYEFIDPIYLAYQKLRTQIAKFPSPFNSVKYLSNFLIDNEAVITGSFMISCFIDMNFSDVDIFVRGGYNYRNIKSELSKEDFDNQGEKINYIDHLSEKFEKGGFIFDVCEVINKNVKEYINLNFDLNICCIYWDGKNIEWSPELSIDNLLKKEMTVNLCKPNNDYIIRKRKRYEKYLGRGFTDKSKERI